MDWESGWSRAGASEAPCDDAIHKAQSGVATIARSFMAYPLSPGDLAVKAPPALFARRTMDILPMKSVPDRHSQAVWDLPRDLLITGIGALALRSIR